MAKFRILLFAVATELSGTDSVEVDVDLPVTAGELLAAVGEEIPALRPWLPSCRLAVAQQYVPDDHLIAELLEVALIPPVSGG